MNRALVVLSTLAFASAFVATSCPVMGHAQILILQSCALFYGVLGTALFKLARTYKYLVILIRISVLHESHKRDFERILPPSGSLQKGALEDSPAMAPYALVDMMRGILTDYEADFAASQRSPEPARQRQHDARVVTPISKAGQPVDPAQPGGFENPARTDGNVLNWVARRLAIFPGARPAHGFFRTPWLEKIGRPVTTQEMQQHELEMIQYVDGHKCMLKLCCEIGAEPERHVKYHFRVVMFLQGLRKMAGENSVLLRRYENAFKKGHNQFRGDSPMCAKVYESCR